MIGCFLFISVISSNCCGRPFNFYKCVHFRSEESLIKQLIDFLVNVKTQVISVLS